MFTIGGKNGHIRKIIEFIVLPLCCYFQVNAGKINLDAVTADAFPNSGSVITKTIVEIILTNKLVVSDVTF